MAGLLVDPETIATALVSEQFIEGFLVQALQTKESAATVLSAMQNLGYEKHARPLLLAFEAALEDRAAMLTELEPEIQGATKLMFARLQGKPEA